jgi:sugar phosphate isomerase/epimerase
VSLVKLGVHLASLRMPFKKALHTAAELGAQGVEIDARAETRPRNISRTGLRQLRKMLDDLNLRVCAVSFRTRRGYGVTEDLDRRVQGTKEALQFAFDLGTNVVVNHLGRVPDESSGPQWELLLDVLGELGAYSHRVGAVLAAETGSEDGSDLARLIDALPPGSLAVTLNPARLIVHGFSPDSAVQTLGQHIMYAYANDAVRDLSQGGGTATPLGRGSVDVPALLGALQEHAYRGYFTAERALAQDPVAEIGQALEYLRNLA